MSAIADQLGKTDLFKEVDPLDLEALVSHMKEQNFPEGAVLFKAGDAGDAMYIIQAGRIRIFMHDAAHNEITLTHYGQNEIFGELSPIDERPRSASAAAAEPLGVLVLNRDDFLTFLNERPQIGLAMMRSLAQRLRNTTTYLEEFKPTQFEPAPSSMGEEFRPAAQDLVAGIIDRINEPNRDEHVDVPAYVETPSKIPTSPPEEPAASAGMGIFDRIVTPLEAKEQKQKSEDEKP